MNAEIKLAVMQTKPKRCANPECRIEFSRNGETARAWLSKKYHSVECQREHQRVIRRLRYKSRIEPRILVNDIAQGIIQQDQEIRRQRNVIKDMQALLDTQYKIIDRLKLEVTIQQKRNQELYCPDTCDWMCLAKEKEKSHD